MTEEAVKPDVKQDEVTPDVKPVDSIPYDRFKEVNDKAKELEAKLAKIEADQKKAKEARMAAEGEKDELIQSLTSERDSLVPYRERLETYEATRREALLSKLPEDDRELFGDLPLEKLEKIASKTVKSVPNVDNSPPVGDTMGYSDALEVVNARKRGEIDETLQNKLLGVFRRKLVSQANG